MRIYPQSKTQSTARSLQRAVATLRAGAKVDVREAAVLLQQLTPKKGADAPKTKMRKQPPAPLLPAPPSVRRQRSGGELVGLRAW
eukprot:883732-Prorocentrum_minimum.AAC.1